MKQIKFGFAQPEATNHVFVCTNCETPLITHKDCKPYCPTCRKSNKGKWLEQQGFESYNQRGRVDV